MTFLIATPTFLQATCGAARPRALARCNMCWWEPRNCRSAWPLAFEDQFGIRPLEGYGCTECSPVVTVNGKDFRAPGFRQVAAKRGKIGHPLPGVSVKVVDIETGQPVAPGNSGMLLVKGPNVMRAIWANQRKPPKFCTMAGTRPATSQPWRRMDSSP